MTGADFGLHVFDVLSLSVQLVLAGTSAFLFAEVI
jgi:hypothetical protein